MPLRPLETLLAFKALNLIGGLTENDRRVAASLVEHFNRRTGRCDPSIGRIAKLLDIHPRTVKRSVKRLESAGIIRTHRHGGHSNCNSYAPDWSKLEAVVREWQLKFSGRAAGATELSLEGGRACHLGGDSRVIQTYPNHNLPNATCSAGPPRRRNAASSLSVPIAQIGARTIRSADAMRAAAERRWSDSLLREFASKPVTYSDIVSAITPEIQEAATDAELQTRGGGIAYVTKTLGVWSGRRNSN
jgi:predicted transcriptional regulator